MISNRKNISQYKQLNTCLHRSIIKNSSLSLDSTYHSQTPAENTMSNMSTLTATVAAASAKQNALVESPMDTVVVNSIIYSKPSFCRISVDLSDASVEKKSTSNANLTNGKPKNNIKCFSETLCPSAMDLENEDFNIGADLATGSLLNVEKDAKLYRMCTTINGSINHHIYELCDNILSMAEIFGSSNNDNDDDSFIDFAYGDDDEERDFLARDDYYDEIDDESDVVDFSFDCLNVPEPKLNCDREKKVRFNLKPTVHLMHTWNFAYRAARKGEWQMYARDRERFNLRIQRTALILNPIFEKGHRQNIYENRFADLCKKEDAANETSANTESKKPHQKKKKRKRRFCKMGNKHYF